MMASGALDGRAWAEFIENRAVGVVACPYALCPGGGGVMLQQQPMEGRQHDRVGGAGLAWERQSGAKSHAPVGDGVTGPATNDQVR
jgi:hypothetical protein